MEVTACNFENVFDEIKTAISKAAFVALDTEFTALYVDVTVKPSIFDTPAQRYDKLRTLNESHGVLPIQVGLTPFRFNADSSTYEAQTFTFYVWPRPFLLPIANQSMTFTTSSFRFLCDNQFDFNKLIYDGVPYLNGQQEAELRAWFLKHSKEGATIDSVDVDTGHYENFFEKQLENKVNNWLFAAQAGDTLELPEINKSFRTNLEAKFFMHVMLRTKYLNELWTYETESLQFFIQKVTIAEFNRMEKEKVLTEQMLHKALGFTRVFRLLQGKTIVGHNLLMDLLLLYSNFQRPLPATYKEFKKAVLELFPAIYDTKSLCFAYMNNANLRSLSGTLENLYEYFNGLPIHHGSPMIVRKQIGNEIGVGQFHNAGYDSFCTGFVFVQLAQAMAPSRDQKERLYWSTHLNAISEFKNKLNLIRCSASHMCLDGRDPRSTRPPCLIALSKDRLNLRELSDMLSGLGYMEIKRYTSRSALIAVDNFKNAREILQEFASRRNEPDIEIVKYNMMNHSPKFKFWMWTGIISISGGLIITLIKKVLK